ncbi:CDP-alcohol phosphatidyltransferase family protein [Flavobacterium humi]|uniref:Phosphatidylserine synthase n=1 Tax=Flavobacterium humi TaxID=2562683 RepID=A0A4Z0L7S9_9FLAO|nr:CDP-alcohol phosphatidyltransferase family protein [Flavobacterium humi]TGD57175.1 phosphatidylserine synthase [Flavobacterium humi]
MNIKKHIPNIITLLNLFCGCIALVFVSEFKFEMAFLFVCLGIFLDFFDGFFARLFKVSSPLGLQLDSLADMVTSGVVPGYVMFMLLKNDYTNAPAVSFLPYLGFVITLGACYRLANFNIDTRQTDSFIGLPTPANALFMLSLPLIAMHHQNSTIVDCLGNQWVLIAITLLSAYIMNAEIPLFSLKIKDFSFKKNTLQILFLASSIILLLVFRYLGIPVVIVFYILLSIANNAMAKKAS